jgi:hypothetical protein
MLTNRKWLLQRYWSNKELKKFAHLFTGSIINVSGWKDDDKEGNKYKDYFNKANSYFISNWEYGDRGIQGYENEFSLDLIVDLSDNLINKFDVVFNHTTLEHIYKFKKAFSNLCLLSKDIVIIIVPFLQEMHGEDDYWRFSPLAIKNLFEENEFKILYLNFNHHRYSSVYIFAIGSKNPEKWKDKIKYEYKIKIDGNYCGSRAIDLFPYIIAFKLRLQRVLKKLLDKPKT